MKHLQGLHVLILGLGVSGMAMARWCVRCGAAEVRVADTRSAPPQAAELQAQLPAVTLVTGPFSPTLLEPGVQLLLKSPGLAPTDSQVSALLQAAHERGIAVRGELSLFASALADLKGQRRYDPAVLAITGTNGKTTTTALTALLIERSGWRVGVAGNIGPTMLDCLAVALDQEDEAGVVDGMDDSVGDNEDTSDGVTTAAPTQDADDGVGADEAHGETSGDARDDETDEGGGPPAHLIPPPPPGPVFTTLPQAWVLELSSFQLDGVSNFEPTAAAVLNVTQDHLDWHGSMAAYAEAKSRIFGRQALMVINADDPLVEAMVTRLTPAIPTGRGAKGASAARQPKPEPRQVVRFGLKAPTRPGDWGLVQEAGMAWLARARDHELLPSKRHARQRRVDDEETLSIQRLMPAEALRIRGRHNAANALAALALAVAAGRPLAPMLHGLREYQGEPHRVALAAVVGGVEVYDDSKGTNVGATVAAIQGLGVDRAPSKLVVILGGDGKGQDFSPLAEPVARYVRAVALIGCDAAAIERALRVSCGGAGDNDPLTMVPPSVVLQRFDSLEAATCWSLVCAHPGDAVLLSPACASLDMFRHYGHRAEVFVQAVTQWATEHGEALV